MLVPLTMTCPRPLAHGAHKQHKTTVDAMAETPRVTNHITVRNYGSEVLIRASLVPEPNGLPAGHTSSKGYISSREDIALMGESFQRKLWKQAFRHQAASYVGRMNSG